MSRHSFRPPGPMPMGPPGMTIPNRGVNPLRTPQDKVDEFWEKFTTKAPGKAITLLPKNELTEKLAKRSAAKDLAGGETTATTRSYEEAAALCKAKVAQIVSECRRVNQKYRDPHFDLDFDLRTGRRDCLESLSNDKDDYYYPSDSDSEDSITSYYRGVRGSGDLGRVSNKTRNVRKDQAAGGEKKEGAETSGLTEFADGYGTRCRSRWPGADLKPQSVKRVGEIFDDPKFFIEGPSANDVRQGHNGDCWLMAALCTLSNKPGLIERVCVAQDPDVGVYGFVFHRDGEWFSEIIDDQLYLIKPDYDQAFTENGDRNLDRILWDKVQRDEDTEEIYRKTYQSGSSALYFAQCAHPNETWLPLLEKAYAKAHGDYAAIEGGYVGEGIEDLTGGVTTSLFTADILDKEYFWKEELMKVNQDFLFGCATGLWGLGWGERRGIQEHHAYSIMRAVEIDGQRLLLLKNPWGKGEWKGAWSDGSKEWTPEWLKKLNHRFGDDGAFWMSYKDLLRKFTTFDRTRLFGPEWRVTSMWTTLNVPWAREYHHTKFSFTLAKKSSVVIVLSQLDSRYFRGLEGQYRFGLAFRVHRAGEENYLVRTHTNFLMTRSCNVELELQAGEYTVLVKLDATRVDGLLPPEEVVRLNVKKRREKLLRIGLAYDIAHSKARIVETEEEKAAREAYEKRKREKLRKKLRKELNERRKEDYYLSWKKTREEWKTKARDRKVEKKLNKKLHDKRMAAKERAARKRREKMAKKVKRAEDEKEDEPSGKEIVDKKQEQLQKEKDDKAVNQHQSDGNDSADTRNEEEKSTETKAGIAQQQSHEEKPAKVTTDESKSVDDEQESASNASEGAEATPSSSSRPAADVAHQNPEKRSEEAPSTPESAILSAKSNTTDKKPNTVEPSTEEAACSTKTAAERTGGDESKPSEDKPASPKDSQVPVHEASGDKGPAGSKRATKADQPELEAKLRKALDIISAFKSELEGLLGGEGASKGRQDDRDDHDKTKDEVESHPDESIHKPPHTRDQPDHESTHEADQATHRSEPEESEDEFSDHGSPSPSDYDFSLPSLSDVSDTELEQHVKAYEESEKLGSGGLNRPAQVVLPGPGLESVPPPPGIMPGPSGDDEPEPWNAVAVVGLRIYYKVSEEDKDTEGLVKIKVVRPDPWAISDSEDEEDDEGEEGDDEKEKREEEKKEECDSQDVEAENKSEERSKEEVEGIKGEDEKNHVEEKEAKQEDEKVEKKEEKEKKGNEEASKEREKNDDRKRPKLEKQDSKAPKLERNDSGRTPKFERKDSGRIPRLERRESSRVDEARVLDVDDSAKDAALKGEAE